MRNDNHTVVMTSRSARKVAAENRAQLLVRPECLAALRQGYTDGLSGITGPWPTRYTLGDDNVQRCYAFGRHAAAVAKAAGKPKAWAKNAIYPLHIQESVSAAYRV
jgi:hypothetical protein